jgi:hypothetical protein
MAFFRLSKIAWLPADTSSRVGTLNVLLDVFVIVVFFMFLSLLTMQRWPYQQAVSNELV